MQQEIKPHVAKYKKRLVEEFVKLMSEYPIVGVLNVENLPAPQFQKMRASLRDKVVIRMAKRRLIKIAIENVKDKKKGIEQLDKYLVGMPALIFTKDNPFNLSKILKKSKSKAPAKAGQTAPVDIVIQAGPTPFAPGPIIGELNSIGLKTSVEGGKVAIVRQTTIAKEGEQISAEVAGILSRLGITPMEIGLDLVAAYEEGIVFTKDVLLVDEEEYMKNLKSAANDSFNLSVFIGYITKDNVELLIKKVFNDAKALAVSKDIISDEFIKQMLSKAEQQMKAIKDVAKIEEIKEEEKEEIKPEIKEEVIEKRKEIKKEPEIKEEPKPIEKPEIKEEIKPEVKEIPKPDIKKEIKEEKIEVPKEEKPKILEGIKEKGIEIKEKITEDDMKKAEEFVKQLQEKVIRQEVMEKTAEESPEVEKKDVQVDDKVREMVKKAKEFASGVKQPTSEDILEEVEEESPKPERKGEFKLPSLQELAEQAKKRERERKKKEVPSTHELAKRKKGK